MSQYPTTKQQILCYILRTTVLQRPSPQQSKQSLQSSEIQQNPSEDMEITQTTTMDQLETSTPVLDTTEVGDINETVDCSNLTLKNVQYFSTRLGVIDYVNDRDESVTVNLEGVECSVGDFFPVAKSSLEKDISIMQGISIMEGAIPITKEVFTTSELKYLVKIDGQEFAFADDLRSAYAIVNSIATAEVKKLSKPGKKVFRRDLDSESQVQVCTQTTGYLLNGGITKEMILTIVPVPRTFIVRSEPVGITL